MAAVSVESANAGYQLLPRSLFYLRDAIGSMIIIEIEIESE